MENAALVELALAAQACSNKELALRLGVSPSQISSWKNKTNGGHMSAEMHRKIRELAGLHDDQSATFVIACGGMENSKKWEHVLQEIALAAADESETGYDTDDLMSPAVDLFERTFDVLSDMGVEIPKVFPPELEADAQSEESERDEFHDHPLGQLIYFIYRSYNDVSGFYSAYISELAEDDRLFCDDTVYIYRDLLSLAAAKIESAPDIATKFTQFRSEVLKEYSKALSDLKRRAAGFGIPLRAELMDMVRLSHDELSQEAERESFGFNKNQDHPDIYMNEILQGIRGIELVLPAIIKKLGITAEDIEAGVSFGSED